MQAPEGKGWDLVIILASARDVRGMLGGYLCLTFNVRGFLFGLKSAQGLSLLSLSRVRSGRGGRVVLKMKG